MRAVAAYAILNPDMHRVKLFSLLLLSFALGLAPLYPAPAHAAPMHHEAAHADRGTAHAGMSAESSLSSDQSSAHECGQSQAAQNCDGQCCGVCIFTLAGFVPHIAAAAFGVSDSPAYRARAYTSFVATPFGRPPQS